MEAIKREVGFTGTLEQFFEKIRTDPKLKYPNTKAGREAYLTDARAVIAAAMEAAPRYFSVLPKAALEVRRSEEHTSELQSLMRLSYAVFCLNKNNNQRTHT